ncbi:hypothetical protein FVB9288_01121 [Flavobacterium sp. CECT 9288]|uniref:hypothetical protein n=1 Tax=Flavobacterium sp. CECT 9288 TaxID=2845819 RepID=UPI001E64BBA7|nr:hypothetical protein [Flavobacterium sp. CECT 9288]CAH0335476.1 hypothetical protein FVB9288_01121 [Flavobacterium sp. CECT 9288]
MESESMNDLINKVKSNNQQNKIQKIVPVSNKEIEEVQFSFYIEKELYKKLKLKAFQNEISMKEIVNNALRNSLD